MRMSEDNSESYQGQCPWEKWNMSVVNELNSEDKL